MKYNFKCYKCGKEKVINAKMSSIKETEVTCDCGNNMELMFTKNLIVPNHMKSENISQMATLSTMMASTMPSGKKKALY